MLHDEQFYGLGTVGEKGQIVIPIKARGSLDIKPGEEFIFFGHDRMIHLIRARELNGILDKLTQGVSSIKAKLKQSSKK